MEFALGRREATPWNIAAYNISDWRLFRRTDDKLVFLPSLATFGRRLGWSLTAVGLAFTAQYQFNAYFQEPGPKPELRPVTEAQRARAQQDYLKFGGKQRDLEAMNQERYLRELRDWEDEWNFYYLACGTVILLGVSAVWAPVSCIWGRVTIADDGQGRIRVTDRPLPLWRRTRRFPLEKFKHIYYGCEKRNVGSHEYPKYEWRWFVRIQPPLHAHEASPDAITFYPHISGEAPADSATVPTFVETITRWLYGRTGCRVQGPILYAEDRFGNRRRLDPGEGGYDVREAAPTVSGEDSGPTGRSAFTGQVCETEDGRREYFITDSYGKVRVFHALEEVPEQLRRLFDK